MATPEADLVVYYNSRCPICDAGIAQQKRLMARQDLARRGLVDWRDINHEPNALMHCSVSIDEVRRRLHALEQGRLLIGIDVAIAIMRRVPAERWLAGLLSLPGLYGLSAWAYNRFALHLERWNLKRGHWQAGHHSGQ